MLRGGFMLAVLGTIDSLLTSLIADNVTRTQHRSNRELVGQGIGNMVAGLFGAIPGAGATMRTVINVRAGGRTPISGALHALVLFALVLGLAPLAERIPHAVLAGILLKVGWDIIDWDFVKRLRGAPISSTVVMATVLVLTIFVDLITAVAVGFIMKSLVSADTLGRLQVAGVRSLTSFDQSHPLSDEEARLLDLANGRILLFRLEGAFSFASTRELTRLLSTIDGDYPIIIFDIANVEVMDTSAIMALKEVIHRLRDAGHQIMVSGVDTPPGRMMARLKVLDEIPLAHRFTDLVSAIRAKWRGCSIAKLPGNLTTGRRQPFWNWDSNASRRNIPSELGGALIGTAKRRSRRRSEPIFLDPRSRPNALPPRIDSKLPEGPKGDRSAKPSISLVAGAHSMRESLVIPTLL
jgi:SulP family sulfate permease